MTRRLTYVELDAPRCSLVYGSAPCQARVGTTGPDKCKNTANTCQDFANYSGTETTTLRWVISSDYVPSDPYAVPSISSVSIDAQRINPGENLGKRERVTISFANHTHGDTDLDPYVEDRDYNPVDRGTYWGKFAAMWPNISGYPLRIIRGTVGDSYADMERSHYVASEGKLTGDKSGYQITAKDALDYAEGNKSLCPLPSEGVLASDITETTSSVTLAPPGIGDTYPDEFNASIGDEAVRCTRSGDVITFTERGAFFTTAEEHDEGDTLQIMASFEQMRPDQILTALLSYTSLPQSIYDTDAWEQSSRIIGAPRYTGYVSEPTEVFKLIEEIMVDFALDIHADVVRNKIVMEYLVLKSPSAELSDDVIDGPKATFYPRKRVDLLYFSFGRKNPLEKMDEPKNYPTTLVRPSENPRAILQGNLPAIRSHYSRWIPGALRSEASNSARFIVTRYEIAPRGLTCTIPATFAPKLSDIILMRTSVFEDEWGGSPQIPMQVVKCQQGQGNYSLELEEFRASSFDPVDPDDPDPRPTVIALDEDRLNMGDFNSLRELYDFYYGDVPIPDNAEIHFEANPGVVFGSVWTTENDGVTPLFAVDVGDWPEVSRGVTISIFDLTILGAGGNAGRTGPGLRGGPALKTRVPIRLVRCVVGGGGGGGGGASVLANSTYYMAEGGGGAGRNPGRGFRNGTDLTGGTGQNNQWQAIGGNGGDIGKPGQRSITGQVGGLPGVAIDGASFVTLVDTDVYGPTQN